VDNGHFGATFSAANGELALWCLAPGGGALRMADGDRPFELTVWLARGAADEAVGCLHAASALSFRDWWVAAEPRAVTVLRRALYCATHMHPFKSVAECVSEYWDAMNAALGTPAEEYAGGMCCQELAPGIFHVEFGHQLLMASTMLRFQERYECPCDALRGRSFSLAEYRRWERGSEEGFRYYDTWSGFNVPGGVVRAVLADGELLPRERALERVLAPALAEPRFYVIGTCGPASLAHELSHGLYEMRDGYRTAVDRELAAVPERLLARMRRHLLGRGYAEVERILRDEVHAYLLEGHALGCDASETALFTYRLRSVFHEHAGELGWQLLPD